MTDKQEKAGLDGSETGDDNVGEIPTAPNTKLPDPLNPDRTRTVGDGASAHRAQREEARKLAAEDAKIQAADAKARAKERKAERVEDRAERKEDAQDATP